MKKNFQTPGTVLKTLLEKHGLNCNRLAKAINMSNAMVRLLILDKSPVSVPAALRLAKFFKNKPEFWLDLQMDFDLSKALSDKVLAKELNGITDVSNFHFVRKPHASKAARKTSKKTPGRKTATLASKRKAAAKVPGSRPARGL
jgi:addiction module HigA family antidote